MRGVPDCLNRRYKALDELVNELSSAMPNRYSGMDVDSPSHDPGVKLMCNFWNILKESPDCNLPQAVHERMCMNAQSSSSCIPPQHFTCYMAHADKKPIKSCCGSEPPSGHSTPLSAAESDLPLSKVLCNLKAAASFDKKCTARLNDLLATEKQLKDQIQILEAREKNGVGLLKQADCMWTCMEEAYKQKVATSLERQKTLLIQFKEVETSANKWRKTKKDLESQVDSVNKCHTEIVDKVNQKKNDIKYLDMEIEGFKKRIAGNKKESTAVKNSLSAKRHASDAKIAAIAAEVKKLQGNLTDERKRKTERDYEGAQYIKEAREELQKINRVLLQKTLENEDKKAEKEALLLEIDLLNDTCLMCKEKCKKKQLTIGDEINKVDAKIATFKIQCIQCHQCIDTSDVRKICTDCPNCAGDRECIIDGDHCDPDHSYDCICQMIKRKFLDNVFDNMYTVLEKESKTKPGKAVASAVMRCLKQSRNGKLNAETRKILQDFVLMTVKRNLNLTIVGGAVKTRCEMDPETYKTLMNCLKKIKPTPPPKADKGTAAKKDPCRRWGGTSECNCPKGPKSCVCTRKAPPAPNDPNPCPQQKDKEDVAETMVCPHKKDTPCGPDCGMHLSSNIGSEVAEWKRDPCQGPSCKFKNMRAAQCILGPESLSSTTTQSYKTSVPFMPDIPLFGDQISCKCAASSSKKPCSCFGDSKQLKAEIATECNKDSCADIWEKLSDIALKHKLLESDVYTEFFRSDSQSVGTHKPTKVQMEQNVKNYKSEENKVTFYKIPDVQKEVFSSYISEDSKESPANTDMRQNFKTSQIEFAYIAPLTYTKSGALCIELDEEIIHQISKKSMNDPVMFVGIRETFSGHTVLVFNPPPNTSLIRILVKKTISGNISLKVTKSMVVKSLPCDKSKDVVDCASSISIDVTKSNVSNQIKNAKNNHKSIKSQLECETSVVEKMSENTEIKQNPVLPPPTRTPETKLYKIRTKGGTDGNIPKALLKLTPSGNYILILDKEFEIQHSNSISRVLGIENECFVELHKTNSDTIVVYFEKSNDNYTNQQNAVLVKSPSGSLKIFVNGPVFENLSRHVSNVDPKSLEGLLGEPIFRESDIKREKYTKRDTKSSSDSKLNENLRVKFQDREGLFAAPLATLKMTSSGKYAVVLNKESKKTFANDLKNFLANRSQELIPIKKTDDGEITIVLSGDSENKGQYGSLKITPSGNIYVLVQESVIQELTKNIPSKNFSICVEGSEHFIRKVQNPENKGVATNCNAIPDDCLCDASKCVCEKLSDKKKHWLFSGKEERLKLLRQKCGYRLKMNKSSKSSYGKNKCDASSSKQLRCTSNERNKSPHIVIKPCGCYKEGGHKKRDEQCFYMFDSVCPLHKHRYNTVSNEILEISGLCNYPNRASTMKNTEDLSEPKCHCETCQNSKKKRGWNSLPYLPPQLPPCIKSYCYP